MEPPHITFWSSTELGAFMYDLCDELGDANHRFFVSKTCYANADTGFAHLWLRVQQYVVYPVYLCGSLLFGKKADVVVVCTNTFYAPWLASFFHKRVVHLVYDLFPEALQMVGTTKGTKSTEDRHGKGVVVRR